jgi:hypothetical protein
MLGNADFPPGVAALENSRSRHGQDAARHISSGLASANQYSKIAYASRCYEGEQSSKGKITAKARECQSSVSHRNGSREQNRG